MASVNLLSLFAGPKSEIRTEAASNPPYPLPFPRPVQIPRSDHQMIGRNPRPQFPALTQPDSRRARVGFRQKIAFPSGFLLRGGVQNSYSFGA